jgi:predicted transposase YbfD/YdcC
VLALKGNQPQLHEAVVETFAVEQAEGFEGCDHDFHQTVNKNHGRIETRRCWVIGTPEYTRYADPDGIWSDLHSLVMIEAQRRQGDQVTSETRYYISRLPADARGLLQAVRSHWGIENALHWVLDMAFREDASRIRTGHAAHNLSILRRLALNLLRRETTAKGGIAARLERQLPAQGPVPLECDCLAQPTGRLRFGQRHDVHLGFLHFESKSATWLPL